MSLTRTVSIGVLWLAAAASLPSQIPPAPAGIARLLRISSSLQHSSGQAAARMQPVTFTIYASERGGTALWQETQTVLVDQVGRYNVVLGVTNSDGLPDELFSTHDQRWLGARLNIAGEMEQRRIPLLPGTPHLSNSSETTSTEIHTESVSAPPSESARMPVSMPRFNSTGTTNSIAMFTDASGDIGNSVLYQSAGRIGLGTTAPLDYFHVVFSDTTGGATGYAVQNLAGGAASYSGMLFYDQNGALAQFQGFNNSTHEYRINNIASNGSINFMLGSSKFQVRSDGDLNIAGSVRKGGTLFLHNLGTQNTALGISALGGVTSGTGNTADGYQALMSNTTGGSNTAVGMSALANNITGSGNTAIGANAGLNTTGSNNILIANQGVAAESATIRIGDSNQTRAFIAGVHGVMTGGTATAVMIDTNGQLGTISSSLRFKTDIQDMGSASRGLLNLRPVTFHYKQHPSDRLEYGLIAEEVAEVYPDLVVTGKDGNIETVQYHKLTPMLVNELQRERREFEEKLRQRDETIQQQEELNRQLEARLAALEKRFTATNSEQ